MSFPDLSIHSVLEISDWFDWVFKLEDIYSS